MKTSSLVVITGYKPSCPAANYSLRSRARAGYTPEFVQQPVLEANELAHMRGEYVYVSDELHEAAIAEAFDIIGGRLQDLAVDTGMEGLSDDDALEVVATFGYLRKHILREMSNWHHGLYSVRC